MISLSSYGIAVLILMIYIGIVVSFIFYMFITYWPRYIFLYFNFKTNFIYYFLILRQISLKIYISSIWTNVHILKIIPIQIPHNQKKQLLLRSIAGILTCSYIIIYLVHSLYLVWYWCKWLFMSPFGDKY